MAMPEENAWVARLAEEIARELGQPVTLAPGGAAPDGGPGNTLILPQARLRLIANEKDLAGLLVEGRLIEAEQADPPMVHELWSGILTGVATRLGGTCEAVAEEAVPELQAPLVCTLQLGAATVQMAIGVEEIAKTPGLRGVVAQPAARLPGNYDLLLEVELDASVRFGTREMQLRDLLELGPGDVVDLDRHVSDPVDLIAGDKIVAHGEVVLVNGNFGLRVTEVAEPVCRLESIRCLL
jgi:flagellar motor switch protein FliN/FliY